MSAVLLPPFDHKLRKTYMAPGSAWLATAHTLIEPGRIERLPEFEEALTSFRRTKGVRSIITLARRADGEVWLIKVTHASWSKLWNFGNPLAVPEIVKPKMRNMKLRIVERGERDCEAEILEFGKVRRRIPAETRTKAERAAVLWLRKNVGAYSLTIV